VIVERGRGSFGGEFEASHCNQWGLCDALFSNYFEDLLVFPSRCRSWGSSRIQHSVSNGTRWRSRFDGQSHSYARVIFSILLTHKRIYGSKDGRDVPQYARIFFWRIVNARLNWPLGQNFGPGLCLVTSASAWSTLDLFVSASRPTFCPWTLSRWRGLL